MNKPFQRIGSKSNAQVGKDFENKAREFFKRKYNNLDSNFKTQIGVGEITKEHAFDLGSEEEKIIIECKSHKWTAPNENVPSAKLSVWNEAMFYFFISPQNYKKIFFVLKDFSEKRNLTLAQYYLQKKGHLIPSDVEIWEFCEEANTAFRLPLDLKN